MRGKAGKLTDSFAGRKTGHPFQLYFRDVSDKATTDDRTCGGFPAITIVRVADLSGFDEHNANPKLHDRQPIST